MSLATRRPKGHYAWAVCFACGVMLFCTVGLGVNVFSVYQPYIIRLNGFTNAQGSLITTTRSLFSLLSMLLVGRFCQKLGLRNTAGLGLLLLAGSYVLFGLADSFGAYCAAAVLSGMAYALGGMIPLSIVIGHWFRDRRGFAVGLSAAGSGVATILVPPILNQVIETWGLRGAFLGEAAFILALGLFVWLIIRDRPEDKGLSPYRLGGADAPLSPPRSAPRGLSPLRWGCILFSIFILGGPTGPGFSHLTVLYTNEGYSEQTVAWLLAYMGVTLTLGKALYGQVADRIGGWRSNCLIGFLYTAAQVLCCLAPFGGMVTPVLAMTLLGFGFPISSVSLAIWAQDLTGDEGYERSVTWFTVAYAMGNLCFGPLPGIIADRTGSYAPAYLLFILFTLFTIAVVQSAYHKLGVGKHPGRTA